MKGKRITYIDIAKALALFFVVLGHLPIKQPAFNFIFSFHMPLFFILSGMTLNIYKYNFIDFIKKKAKQIIIPYIIFSIIGVIICYFIPDWKNGITMHRIFELFVYKTQPELFHVGQLWFLICLFVANIMFYVVEKYIIKNRSKLFSFITYIILSIIAFNIMNIINIPGIIKLPINSITRLPFKIDSALMALIFLKIGNTITKYKVIDRIGKLDNIEYILVSLILILTNVFMGPKVNGYVNLCDAIYGNYINYFVASITGSLFFILLAYKINNNKILNFIGKNTLVIFAIHSMFIALTKFIIEKLPISIEMDNIYINILRAIIILIMTIPFVYIYNHIKKYICQYKIIKIK